MKLAPIISDIGAAPVDVAYVKANAVIDFDDDDSLLQSYIDAAMAYLDGPDGTLGRAIRSQTVSQPFSGFAYRMDLPYGHARDLVSVTYFDQDDAQQTLYDGNLLRDGRGSYLRLPSNLSLPAVADRPDAVSVTYLAGYADAASVPASLKLAIARLVGGWFDQRTEIAGKSMAKVPYGVDALLAPLRRVTI